MIGLSTYAFFWQWHETRPRPLSLPDMLSRTAELGADLFQVCDYPAIEAYDDGALRDLRQHAEALGLGLELGTRGVTPDRLERYLDLARRLDVTLVRSMVPATSPDAVEQLRAGVPAYERAGVRLALETYEQVPTRRLLDIVDAVDSPALGICLDPANCVAALEHPRDTVELTAERVLNLHVKDFAFSRQAGWVGFTFAGARLGEGLLDLDHLFASVRPEERGISQVVEHWLVWQGDSDVTCRVEEEWTRHSLQRLRERSSAA
jgi:sugar phosphate isomerase/epimerase